MGTAQRRAREKENLRRAILDAARELFATESYGSVSIRKIAQRIEYSPTAIYLYFKDKQEILGNLIAEGFAMLYGRLAEIDIADPVERLRAGGRAYFEFALTQPHYYRLMFQLEPPEDCTSNEIMEIAGKTFDFIRLAVAEGHASGQFVFDCPEIVVSHALWCSLHGTVALQLSGHLALKLPEEMYAELYRCVMENALRGLMPH
jgi:AcrR family transcriptional regulator